MKPSLLSLLVTSAAALGGSLAYGHGLDANRVEVVLQGAVVEAVATPPVSFVRGADRDGDGLLSLAEVNAHRDAIRRELVAAMHLTDPEGRAGTLERADISLPRSADGHPGGEFLRVTARWRFASAPAGLRVRFDFVREHPVTVYATHARTLGDGRVALVGAPELAVLPNAQASTTMLRGVSGGAR
ncbi:MAG: hypothetical protein R3A48_27730 [Polyangiales bacterium]